jgi:hypothetical protein
MSTFATQKTGFPVSYIEFSTLALSLVSDPTFKITCAVFTDVSYGSEFTRLLCREILQGFVSSYKTTLQGGNLSGSLEVFQTFNVQISEIIRGSVKPVLEGLDHTRGVTMCALVSHESVLHSTSDMDKVGLLAYHQVLLRTGSGLLRQVSTEDDAPLYIRIQGDKTTLDMYRIDWAYLIVQYKNAVNSKLVQNAVSQRATLLAQILTLTANLQGELDNSTS